jgi:hypothetical protein
VPQSAVECTGKAQPAEIWNEQIRSERIYAPEYNNGRKDSHPQHNNLNESYPEQVCAKK